MNFITLCNKHMPIKKDRCKALPLQPQGPEFNPQNSVTNGGHGIIPLQAQHWKGRDRGVPDRRAWQPACLA